MSVGAGIVIVGVWDGRISSLGVDISVGSSNCLGREPFTSFSTGMIATIRGVDEVALVHQLVIVE